MEELQMFGIVVFCWLIIDLFIFAGIAPLVHDYKNYFHCFWVLSRKKFNIVGSIIIELVMVFIALPALIFWYCITFFFFAMLAGILLSIKLFYLLFGIKKDKQRFASMEDMIMKS